LSELSNGDDLLARLAALEQLLELSETATVSPALRSHIIPHIVQLLEASADPVLQQAAVPAVARLLRDGQDSALVRDIVSKLSAAVQVMSSAIHCCLLYISCKAISEVVSIRACMYFTTVSVLREQHVFRRNCLLFTHESHLRMQTWRHRAQAEDVPLEMEACMLDATNTLAQSTVCREAIATSALLQHSAERSLGRGAPDAVCIPAMHVMAAVGGAQILQESRVFQAAFLSKPVWLSPLICLPELFRVQLKIATVNVEGFLLKLEAVAQRSVWNTRNRFVSSVFMRPR
jgi:hypothetical protein